MKRVLMSFSLALATVFAPNTPSSCGRRCDEDGDCLNTQLYFIDGNSGRSNRSG